MESTMLYDSNTLAAADGADAAETACATTTNSQQLDNRLQVVIWLKEHYRLGDAGSMRKSYVYQHYLDACRESGMEGAPISHTFFGKLVRRAFPGIKCNRKGPRGDAHQCYTHLERLSVAQRLGAWQVEQITEELSKCSSAGASPASSRLSPLRPKTSPRRQLQLGSESDEAITPSSTQPSTPTDENEYLHHRHHHQQQQQHTRRCYSSCCSPHTLSPLSPPYSSPRSSCCSEGVDDTASDFLVVDDQEPACSCPLVHQPHHHNHDYPRLHHATSHRAYEGSLDETHLYSTSEMSPYTPFHLTYPHHHFYNTTISSSAGPFTSPLPLQLTAHQLATSPSLPTTSPALYLPGEEDPCGGIGFGNDHASGATSSSCHLAQLDPLSSFSDYLSACQATRQQGCGAGPTSPEHDDHHHGDLPLQRGGEDLNCWTTTAAIDGCSRTVEPLNLSWTSSGAWTDAIY